MSSDPLDKSPEAPISAIQGTSLGMEGSKLPILDEKAQSQTLRACDAGKEGFESVKREENGTKIPGGCPYAAMFGSLGVNRDAEVKHDNAAVVPQNVLGGAGVDSPALNDLSISTQMGLARSNSSESTGSSSAKSAPRRLLQPVHYHSYLQLDSLLSSQKPKSLEVSGEMAHDEMLFIIVHQAHELWFKQITHDLSSILGIMSAKMIPERELSLVVERLTRISKIQKMLVEHLSVLETMSPLSFLDFREYLYPASGFQSMQFRQLEVRLGLRRGMRATYAGQGERYECALTPSQAQEILALEKDPSLFDLIDKWLARLPVLKTEDFDFWNEYQGAVTHMFNEDEATLRGQYAQGLVSESLMTSRLSEIAKQRSFFKQFFDEEWYEHTMASGARRLSYRACQAALMINFYQEEPLFQIPYQLLTLLLELDANFTSWRSKHAQMVHRMLGLKMGTGGSSGFSYLMQAVNDHKIFSEFFNLASLMVPRAYLPSLPDSVNRKTRFYYNAPECNLATPMTPASATTGPATAPATAPATVPASVKAQEPNVNTASD